MVIFLVIIARQPTSTAQLLPPFSTPNKHSRLFCHSTPPATPIPSIASAHFPSPRGRGWSVRPNLQTFPPPNLQTSSALSFPLSPHSSLATHRCFSQLAENTATLSPLFAALTRSATSKSFACHSYTKHPGVWVGASISLIPAAAERVSGPDANIQKSEESHSG
jgi:hypothetical protein